MKIGVNQWCYAGGTSLADVFRIAAQSGLDSVELNVEEEECEGLWLGMSEERIREIRSMASAAGIALPSVSTSLMWRYPLSSADAATRQKGQNIVRRMLQIAASLGADAVLVVPGVVTDKDPYDGVYERSSSSLRPLVAEAEKCGVDIAIENVWNKFLLSPLEMARFIDQFSSPRVGAYFDVGNVLQFGFPEQWIRILGDRIRKVHVKDFKTSVGNIRGFTELLAGDVPWPAVTQALRDIGYNGYVAAELSAYPHGGNLLIEDTARHMRAIFG